MQVVSSAGLCNAFLEHHDTASFLELTEDDCSGHAHVLHPCDVANPEQLHLEHDGVYAGQVGYPGDFIV